MAEHASWRLANPIPLVEDGRCLFNRRGVDLVLLLLRQGACLREQVPLRLIPRSQGVEQRPIAIEYETADVAQVEHVIPPKSACDR